MSSQRCSSVKRKTESNPYKPPTEKAAKKDISNKSGQPLKEMKKQDLIKHCELLQVAHDQLVKENESLKLLQRKNEELDSKERDLYYCGECDFVATCIHDFTDHSHDEHAFQCYYCEGSFETKLLVMNHTKIHHPAEVEHCVNFLQGTCAFEKNCWFRHDESFKTSATCFKCNFCEKTFKLKWQLMLHKKNEHIHNVSKCMHERNGCAFGSDKCWFIHDDNVSKAFETAKKNNINVKELINKCDTGEITKNCKIIEDESRIRQKKKQDNN